MRNRRVSTNQAHSTLLPSAVRARSETATPDRPHVSNQGIQRLLRAGLIQGKLSVSQPGDRLEQEADRMAAKVMRMPVPHEVSSRLAVSSRTPSVQRAALQGEEDELKRKPTNNRDEEEKLHAKAKTPSVAGSESHSGGVMQALSGGRPLQTSERSFFEPRFGHDFSQVRIHTSDQAASVARSVNAKAFTLGRDIVFGSGEYAPETSAGRELMAHELTHVVQQSGVTGSPAQLQRQVRFNADFVNINLVNGAGAALQNGSFHYNEARFEADAQIEATADTQAELDEWDVGVFQDLVGHWDRYYWRRGNADRRGRFVEEKYLPVRTRFRDQVDGTASVWYADDEHQMLNTVPSVAAGGRLRANTVIPHRDFPNGPESVSGSAQPGMDASDGDRNINIQRSGARFDVWISAHNVVTDAWRHLRRVNWNYQRSLDFTGAGPTLAIGTETWQLGHFGPLGAGRGAPLMAGDTYNVALNDPARYSVRRVNGWT